MADRKKSPDRDGTRPPPRPLLPVLTPLQVLDQYLAALGKSEQEVREYSPDGTYVPRAARRPC